MGMPADVSGRPIGQLDTNKDGISWHDPNSLLGNGVEIDTGVFNSLLKSQQDDHVVVLGNGIVLYRDRRPISRSIKSNYEQAHMPSSENVKWRK